MSKKPVKSKVRFVVEVNGLSRSGWAEDSLRSALNHLVKNYKGWFPSWKVSLTEEPKIDPRN